VFFFAGGGEASPAVPIMASTPVPGTQAAMAAATSPSRMNFVHAPAERVPPPVSLFERAAFQRLSGVSGLSFSEADCANLPRGIGGTWTSCPNPAAGLPGWQPPTRPYVGSSVP
jgi:hypothetical protein